MLLHRLRIVLRIDDDPAGDAFEIDVRPHQRQLANTIRPKHHSLPFKLKRFNSESWLGSSEVVANKAFENMRHFALVSQDVLERVSSVTWHGKHAFEGQCADFDEEVVAGVVPVQLNARKGGRGQSDVRNVRHSECEELQVTCKASVESVRLCQPLESGFEQLIVKYVVAKLIVRALNAARATRLQSQSWPEFDMASNGAELFFERQVASVEPPPQQ